MAIFKPFYCCSLSQIKVKYSGRACFTVVSDLFQGSPNRDIKATRAQTKSMMALTIGTIAALHKSPVQQWSSHLRVTEESTDLQEGCSSTLHSAFEVQPLVNSWPLDFSIITFAQ